MRQLVSDVISQKVNHVNSHKIKTFMVYVYWNGCQPQYKNRKIGLNRHQSALGMESSHKNSSLVAISFRPYRTSLYFFGHNLISFCLCFFFSLPFHYCCSSSLYQRLPLCIVFFSFHLFTGRKMNDATFAGYSRIV